MNHNEHEEQKGTSNLLDDDMQGESTQHATSSLEEDSSDTQ